MTTAYDELNRETLTEDERLAASTLYSTMTSLKEYDAVGNEHRHKVTATPAGLSAACALETTVSDI